ncbi:MAG: hypothetical protein FJZ96_10760 [Chloroflexi bacterium]|nr:hypothetical protein [Chloroflexota bacterium]
MNKTRLFALFVIVFAGLFLTACGATLPADAEIQVASDGQSAQVEFTGVVDSITADQWVIQGYSVLVNAQTVIDGNFAAGDVVHVYAIVDATGTITATHIEPFVQVVVTTPTADASNNDTSNNSTDTNSSTNEAEFTGVVESIAPDQWTVSGQVFLITDQTEIKDEIIVGDTVKIHAFLDANNAFVAREIELAIDASSGADLTENEMELTGVVESITPDLWVVAGLEFTVNNQTEIKDIIAVGDRVNVHLLVNEDGSLTASEIELAEKDENPTAFGMLEMTGVVEAISGDLWTIGGKDFLVTAQTELKGVIVVGDTVKVEAIINEDGSLTATEIAKVAMSSSSENSDSSDSSSDTSDDDSSSDSDSDSSDNSSDDDETDD